MNRGECVAFLRVDNAHSLAERRKFSKPLLTGVIALPVGHMEENETADPEKV